MTRSKVHFSSFVTKHDSNRMASNNFDFLRFFFAFVVVLAHLIDLCGVETIKPLKVFVDSQLAVAGFFIISGHLIYASYLRANSLEKYFFNRAKRLLPAYFVFVLFAPIGLSLCSSFSLQEFWLETGTFKYIVANLSFMNFLAPCLPGVFENNTICAVNGALWTIKIEVGFYLCLPILYFLHKKFQSKVLFYALLYCLGLLYQLILALLVLQQPEKAAFLEVLNHQLPSYLMYFGSGMMLYEFKDKLLDFPILIYLLALVDCSIEYAFSVQILFPLAFAILIMGFAYHFKFLNHWGKFGDFSYGIYLIHFPIIQLAVQLDYFKQFSFLLTASAILFLVLFIAFLSWHLIEKKFLKLR